MKTRARFSRDLVALATIALSAASIAACEGGAGPGSTAALQLFSPPPADNGYQSSIDASTPPPAGGLGGPSLGAPPPSSGGSLPPDSGGVPGGGASCGEILGKVNTCLAGIGEDGLAGDDQTEFLSGCNGASAACRACVSSLSCDAVFGKACASPCGGGGGVGVGGAGGGSSGKGGSNSGKGGSDGGGNGTCAQVIAAIKACPELELPDSVIPQVTATCEPYSGACKACIAALDCEDLAVVVGEQGPEGSKCSSTCTDGGEGGTGGTGGGGPGKGGTGGTGGGGSGKGGTGGTGGTGGSGGTGGTGGSSSGDCASDLLDKSVECEQELSTDEAEQLCEAAPACAACINSAPCSAIESGSCSGSCGQ